MDAKTAQNQPVKRDKRRDSPEKWKKILCRARTAYAVKTGFIKKCACEGCGGSAPVQAHHEDYNRPYMVRWLCAPCHVDVHRYVKLPPKEFSDAEMLVVEYGSQDSKSKYTVKNLRKFRFERLALEEQERRKKAAEQAAQRLEFLRRQRQKDMVELILDWVPKREGPEILAERLCKVADTWWAK